MYKNSKIALIMAVLMMVALPIGSLPVNAKTQLSPGTLIRGKSLSSVYYLGEDNKRYVFPNDRIYFSWHDDFSGVQIINDADLADYALGGNVQYKPGVNLVKIQTDPKVYAVSEQGLLRWIKTEQLARLLYGANWNLLVDDIPDSFFFNYKIGDPINDDDGYDPDEEELQITSISENLGLKLRKQIAKIILQEQKRTCNRLEKAISKIQKRMRHYGIKAGNLGSDYLAQCAEITTDKKVAICHVPPGNTSASSTIIVSKSAAEAHLAHGDIMGACPSTTPSHDKTAPVLSNITANVSTSSATITWATNEPGSTIVDLSSLPFSSSGSYTNYTDYTATTSHSMTLGSLSPATTYYYRVKSKDAAGNLGSSGQLTFVTLSTTVTDTTAPVISNIQKTVSTSTAVITWTTNEASDSKVEYATSPLTSAGTILSAQNSADVTSHSINLSSLTASTTYYFRVTSVDPSGNTATSTEQTFTTASLPAPDTAAPIISGITKTIRATSTTINWTTDEPSTSEITFAKESLSTATSTSLVSSATLVTSHSLDATGLTASTTYYFIIKSVDASSNSATTTESSFTTLGE